MKARQFLFSSPPSSSLSPLPPALPLPPFSPLPLPTFLAQAPVMSSCLRPPHLCSHGHTGPRHCLPRLLPPSSRPKQSIQPPSDVGSPGPCWVRLAVLQLSACPPPMKLEESPGAPPSHCLRHTPPCQPARLPAAGLPCTHSPSRYPWGGRHLAHSPPSLHPSPLHHPAGLAKQEGHCYIKGSGPALQVEGVPQHGVGSQLSDSLDQ